MKKLTTITKQFTNNKAYNEVIGKSKGYSLQHYQSIKDAKSAVAKRKAVNKSNEKIGPKIISKYSVSKYHSNFDDMNFEDAFESDLMNNEDEA